MGSDLYGSRHTLESKGGKDRSKDKSKEKDNHRDKHRGKDHNRDKDKDEKDRGRKKDHEGERDIESESKRGRKKNKDRDMPEREELNNISREREREVDHEKETSGYKKKLDRRSRDEVHSKDGRRDSKGKKDGGDNRDREASKLENTPFGEEGTRQVKQGHYVADSSVNHKGKEKDNHRDKHRGKDHNRDKDEKDRGRKKDQEGERDIESESKRGREKNKVKEKGKEGGREKDNAKDRERTQGGQRERDCKKNKGRDRDRDMPEREEVNNVGREREKGVDHEKEMSGDKKKLDRRSRDEYRSKDGRRHSKGKEGGDDNRDREAFELENTPFGKEGTRQVKQGDYVADSSVDPSQSQLEVPEDRSRTKGRLKKKSKNSIPKIEEKRLSEKEKPLRSSKTFEEQDNVDEDDNHDNTKEMADALAGKRVIVLEGKVLHGVVLEGGAVVLTPKHQDISANRDLNEDVDMREIAEIGEQKRSSEAYKVAKKTLRVYDKHCANSFIAIGSKVHPAHSLELKEHKKPYCCNGCQMLGVGEGYRCGKRDHIFHTQCMRPTAEITSPFLKGETFKFMVEPRQKPCPKRLGCGTYCNACGMIIRGYNYHSNNADYDLHPCCAALKSHLRIGGQSLTLKKGSEYEYCDLCNEKGVLDSRWIYENEDCKFHICCIMQLAKKIFYSCSANGMDLEKLESLQGVKSGKGGKGGKKFWKILKEVVTCVIAVIFGDPTTIAAKFTVEGICHLLQLLQ